MTMKDGIYPALKALEALSSHVKLCIGRNMEKNDLNSIVESYNKIRGDVSGKLGRSANSYLLEESRYIWAPYDNVHQTDSKLLSILQKISVAINYLGSLDGSFRMEMMEKEKELEIRAKEIEYQKKLLDKSLDAIRNFPEAMRSGVVADIKKKHREIEKHTKSGNRREITANSTRKVN